MVWVQVPPLREATGWVELHWATTSRAQPSQLPHWVATPSSNWISSKLMPARAWRAMSRSETRRQTQMIMAVRVAGCEMKWSKYKCESFAFAMVFLPKALAV